MIRPARLPGLVAVAALFGSATLAPAALPVRIGSGAARPVGLPTIAAQELALSVGAGRLLNLPAPMADLFVADDKIADVQVKSPTQLYVFGKGPGETTVSATDKAGNVVYAATVRVGTNLGSLDRMLKLAMPGSDITATVMNGLVLLTGTVQSAGEIEEAQRLTQALAGETTQVVSRLATPVPMQVNLSVRIAEVNRDFAKQIGVNLLNRDMTGGFLFGIAQGRSPGTITDFDYSKLPTVPVQTPFGSTVNLPYDAGSGRVINPARPGTTYNLSSLGQGSGKTSLGFAGKLLGLDLLAALDLAESDGAVSTLAEPNLTTISGETASFLAGGEIPIPVSQGLGAVSITYKQYGVSLSFTPTVFSGGRISMRVRPEVSQLTSAGSVTLNGFTVPGITTRRAETTIELGSGQSFMIGGLLSNNVNNSTEKAPFLGDLPVLGALFRSNSFRRQQTELVIIITPYLVKPMGANTAMSPTDGYRAPTDVQRLIGGQTFDGQSGARAPRPMLATPVFPPETGPVKLAGPMPARPKP